MVYILGMANNENNRILIRELEAHAEQAGLLNEVVNVSRSLKNVKVYKGKYLVLDEPRNPSKKSAASTRSTKKKKYPYKAHR